MVTSILLSLVLLAPQVDFEQWSAEQWQHWERGEWSKIDDYTTGDWSVG